MGEIEAGELVDVPEPKPKKVPKKWLRVGGEIGDTGTLVVWSSIDRCNWRTAKSLFKNSEYTIGRIYRRFLSDGRVTIRMAAFREGRNFEPQIDELARPNDPVYLMANTSCPAPWDKEPMFESYGVRKIPLKHNGKDLEIVIRYSYAKDVARSGHNPGSKPHGVHARDNQGVSVVRADRELELQTEWTHPSEARDRWWGAEVEFPPALDELFGVTNNKQHARSLAEWATMDADTIASREGFETEHEMMEAWTQDGDWRLALLKVRQDLASNISAIRSLVKEQGRSAQRQRTQEAQNNDLAEVIGSRATEKRKEQGFSGTSDKEEQLPPDEREEQIRAELVESGVPDSEAKERAHTIVYDARKYEFVEKQLDSTVFFGVRSRVGSIFIDINTDHPVYEHLYFLLEDEDDTDDLDEIRGRTRKAYEGLKLLLEAWARYEDELPDGQRKDYAREARQGWGQVAKDFLRTD